MNMPGTMSWFAAHEMRLASRDLLAMLTGGKAERLRKVAVGIGIFLAVMHAVAYLAVGRLATAALEHDLATLIAVSAGILLAFTAVVSQAMESVTRVFYTRSDLELILSSPVEAHQLFAVRIGAIALTVGAMSLLFVGPFINVLAWLGGARWLGAYGIIVAIALTATALAVALTAQLFQSIGPKRTRLAAQITAAIVGGLFAIGLQIAALFSAGTLSRFAFLQSDYALANAPALASIVWWPARGALGDLPAMLSVVVVSFVLFLIATSVYARRFAGFVIAASSVSRGDVAQSRARAFAVQAPAATLRRKERTLLLRDPWLLSQSLMQLLYLLPPALMLWHSYGDNAGIGVVLVPVLVMSAGQLAGGLAWLTLCGEDAPDLVLTAPVPERQLLRAKIEAVMQCITAVFLPFVIALAFLPGSAAAAAALGIAAAAASATAIQFWFRAQAKRSQFRRRHTSSRIATLSEALVSISWAGSAAIGATAGWAGCLVAIVPIAILCAVRSIARTR
jgi:ABC-2 type transport system permease protein